MNGSDSVDGHQGLYHPTWSTRHWVERKEKIIWETIQQGNTAKLRRLALSPWGLINNTLRQSAWPFLLGLNRLQPERPDPAGLDGINHKDQLQLQLDVDRSFNHLPYGLSESHKTALRLELKELIVTVLSRHPTLCYYQGYHDICSVFLLVAGLPTATACMEVVSCNHIRAHHAPSIRGAIRHLDLLYSLLHLADPPLAESLKRSGLADGGSFGLSWILTWYSHVVTEVPPMARLFDFFLACPHPLLPTYVAATVVRWQREELLACDNDFCKMFKILNHFPEEVNMNQLVLDTLVLYDSHPPDTLSTGTQIMGKSPSLNQYPYPWIRPDELDEANLPLSPTGEEIGPGVWAQVDQLL
eukprot:Ihof_evm7s73 gene=Ihof_evmTU7s73